MKKQLLFFLCLGVITLLSAQPKITFNTNQAKEFKVLPGETFTIELLVGNYGDEAIGSDYEIVGSFNPVEGFLNSSRYRLQGKNIQGVALQINEQKKVQFQYTVPEDAPEVAQNLIFSARGNDALHLGGGYLFLRVNIESEVPLPDLVAKNFRFPRIQDFYISLDLKFEIVNVGELLAIDTSTTKIYLSRSGEVDENSILLDVFRIPPSVVFEKVVIEKTYNFEGITPAVYQLLVVVDSEKEVPENNEFNNFFRFGFRFPINSNVFPNLYFREIRTPATLTIGDPFANDQIQVSIGNQSSPRNTNVPTEVPFCNRVYLSEDNFFDESDRLLGTASVSQSIDNNQFVNLVFTPNDCFEAISDNPLFPFDISAGSYYLIFELDAEDDIIEASEFNTTIRQIELVEPEGLSNLVITQVSGARTARPGDDTNLTISIYNKGGSDFEGDDSLYIYQRAQVFCSKGPCRVGNLIKRSSAVPIPSIAAGQTLSFTASFGLPTSFIKGSKGGPLAFDQFNYYETYVGLKGAAFLNAFSLQTINAFLFDIDPIYPSTDLVVRLSSPQLTYDSTGNVRVIATVSNEGEETARFVNTGFSTNYPPYDFNFFPEEVNSTAGTFSTSSFYGSYYHNWFIPELLAGASASIELEYYFQSPNFEFTPLDTSIVFASSFAKIIDLDDQNNQAQMEFFEGGNIANQPSITSFRKVSNFQIVPNPTIGEVTISFIQEGQEEEVHFALFNLQGQLLHAGKWQTDQGKNQKQLNLEALPTGAYLLRVGEVVQQLVKTL